MEVLNGFVESIVFRSEDTGYVVCKIRTEKNLINAVGTVPLIKEGQNVKVTGDWTVHKQFGNQFNIQDYEELLPNSLDGIEKYLSAGIIHGIGPVTAKKIIAKFGEETLDIMENHIERLMEIEGIGEKKFQIIYESYIEQQGLKDVILYFHKHGVTNNQCVKIYKKFGVNARQIVSSNPYVLCDEISGIGFKTADRIAMSIGIASDSEFRIQSGIKYVMNQFCAAGNIFMPKENIIEDCQKNLLVSKELIEKNIYSMAAEQKIIVEKVNDIEVGFLLQYYYCELGVTSKIITLGLQETQTINSDIDFEIDVFEKEQKIQFAPSQIEAIKGAFSNGIEIITGGPGTGKTTIIKSIIHIYENNGMKVILGAPTGRAAKRMTESTGREAKTIHRLLEMGVSEDDESVFEKGESSPLDCDVIIIDEASMIDIMLMHSLLKAINLGTRLIIVGDVDQLPSVGPGNVLKDLIECEYIKVVRLKEIFRQGNESLIVVNAHRINEGHMPLLNQKDKDFFFINVDNQEKIVDTIIDLLNRRLPKFNKSWDKLRDMQVLTPMRKGTLGVNNLNMRLQEIFNPASKDKKEKTSRDMDFREGDKVMQTKNNYSLKWVRVNGEGENEGVGVFNGDLGFIQSIDEEKKTLTIIFDDERKVIYDFNFLDELDLAYATTIHKSQGSEFKVVIIPAFMGSPFLMNRNLLYTGITRAKQLVVVVGYQKALMYMVNNTNSMERYSALKYRIRDIITKDEFGE
ncbi:ATP-dependent RecD-like DNA helicase [Clostridium saccharobutylicum]|uniref:ATP-dependent RecD2 DNA helicase n=1 Tax=Clostridium saccharobutylicum DSM 13864 TaxID=1345695 RepID=U5ML77_CLOSA|nr:ATP-dependent RecD-like DNA helicase [Clostridium saccharobutylicum]AGX41549.1 helicase, RecD/TraA family [Clostridium saccharobutylicum DSM 13864]AQR88830.1 ATP-dependent RecD-like DNA helicase [Clostridium saccharobutylicum]AQR98729.1 ATP-dependent RecD-like DNA helicase [Clostridium saccharobutylicum]AQS12719.1 ATP-dependent RecD-like DNA helicase [Clostridium saccharobutylicum]MBA2904171.1 exodeoxyribonuclease V alpha subunit [Clostridium saccharobutylicum]